MFHLGIKLNDKMQAVECLVCKNEEHLEGTAFCMICGNPIVNYCLEAIDENVSYDYSQCSHKEPLPGNARYCPYCRKKTTFFEFGVLEKWDSLEVDPPF